MKPYIKIVGVEAAAEAAYQAWEAEMIKFSRELLEALRDELGWPAQAFERLDTAPGGGRKALGGFTDGNGYHFALQITLGRSWLHVVFVASRAGEDAYDVTIGSETHKVSLAKKETLAPIVEDIVAEMTKTVLEREAAKQTGYKP